MDRIISGSHHKYNTRPNKNAVRNVSNYSQSVQPIIGRPSTTNIAQKSDKKNDIKNKTLTPNFKNDNRTKSPPTFANPNAKPKAQLYMNVSNNVGYEVNPLERKINNNKLRVDHILGFSEPQNPSHR